MYLTPRQCRLSSPTIIFLSSSSSSTNCLFQGDGWYHLKGVHSEKDVLMARERIYHHNKADKAIK